MNCVHEFSVHQVKSRNIQNSKLKVTNYNSIYMYKTIDFKKKQVISSKASPIDVLMLY